MEALRLRVGDEAFVAEFLHVFADSVVGARGRLRDEDTTTQEDLYESQERIIALDKEHEVTELTTIVLPDLPVRSALDKRIIDQKELIVAPDNVLQDYADSVWENAATIHALLIPTYKSVPGSTITNNAMWKIWKIFHPHPSPIQNLLIAEEVNYRLHLEFLETTILPIFANCRLHQMHAEVAAVFSLM